MVNYFENESLQFLDHFVSFEKLNLLTYHIAKKYSEKIKLQGKIAVIDFQKKMEDVYQKENFPVVPTTVDPVLNLI